MKKRSFLLGLLVPMLALVLSGVARASVRDSLGQSRIRLFSSGPTLLSPQEAYQLNMSAQDAKCSVNGLDRHLRNAAGRAVMLDFYADWRVSCKVMEHGVFADPGVRAKLKGAVQLKADVTANSSDDQTLLKRFGLFGPPGILFFDRTRRETGGARAIGCQVADTFLKTLKALP